MSKTRISNDPTPFHPMVLELALLDPGVNVAYLARPCQYMLSSDEGDCDSRYWSDRRFSKEVIDSMNEGVDSIVNKSGASELHLIGYSGGAAIATLLAAQRNDIKSLRTIAGNLDPKGVNEHHQVSSLVDSLGPLDVAARLRQLPQRHFVGSRDTVVPEFIVDRFMAAQGPGRCSKKMVVQGVSHSKGWQEQWRQLLRLPVQCEDTV